MKKYILFFSILAFFNFVNAQKLNVELEKSYSKSELKGMSSGDLNLLEYALNHAIYTTPIPEKNISNLKNIKVPLSIVKFTDASLKIENENQYFRIEGTNVMLVVKSKYVLQNEMLNSKN